MKLCKLFLICGIIIPALAFSQTVYMTSAHYTFSAGNTGGMSGLWNTDVVVTNNSIDGYLEVKVDKVKATWSYLSIYMGNCFSNKMIFNETNRFIEFRIQMASDTPIVCPVVVGGNMDACAPEAKTWPGMSFTLTEPNTWKIIFLRVPPTTGGSQNIIDTVGNRIIWSLPNGNYKFDYVMIGDAATPEIPTIDQIKSKNVSECIGVQNVAITGIEIPNRAYDGLTITAESKTGGILKNIKIVDIGGGEEMLIDEENKSATLQYTPVNGMGGKSDSIIVTLRDTIRNVEKKMAFKVTLLKCTDLAIAEDNISVYPSVTSGLASIDFSEPFSGDIIIMDMVGNIFSTQKIRSQVKAEINLSGLPSGVYAVKISDGSINAIKKVIKE